MLTFTLFKYCLDNTKPMDLHTIMLLEYIMEDTKCYIYNWIIRSMEYPEYTDKYGSKFKITSQEGLYEALKHY